EVVAEPEPEPEPEVVAEPEPEPAPKPEAQEPIVLPTHVVSSDATPEELLKKLFSDEESEPEIEVTEPVSEQVQEIVEQAEPSDEEQPAEVIFTDAPVDTGVAIPLPEFTSDEIADSIDIRNFATLVTLNTARWHAKVKDRKAAKVAADASGADDAAFEARKR